MFLPRAKSLMRSRYCNLISYHAVRICGLYYLRELRAGFSNAVLERAYAGPAELLRAMQKSRRGSRPFSALGHYVTAVFVMPDPCCHQPVDLGHSRKSRNPEASNLLLLLVVVLRIAS